MKKILIISFTFLFFGFTPEYYTHENTDIAYGKKLQEGYEDATVVDKTDKPISGIFINIDTKNGTFNTLSLTPYINGYVNGATNFFSKLGWYIEREFENGQANGAMRYYTLDNQTLDINGYIVSDNFSDIIAGTKKME